MRRGALPHFPLPASILNESAGPCRTRRGGKREGSDPDGRARGGACVGGGGGQLAAVARAAAQRRQPGDGAAAEVDAAGERHLEAAPPRAQRVHADRLGRPHLLERRRRRRHLALDGRSQQRPGALEAAPRRREHHRSQAQHVVALARHRRQDRLGAHRHRHPQGLRLRGQGALVARHPEGLRRLRAQPRLRLVAAAARRRALHPRAARDEDGRPVVPVEDRRRHGQDALASRAADAGAGRSRPTPTSRPRSPGRARRPRSCSTAATSSPGTTSPPARSCGAPTG